MNLTSHVVAVSLLFVLASANTFLRAFKMKRQNSPSETYHLSIFEIPLLGLCFCLEVPFLLFNMPRYEAFVSSVSCSLLELVPSNYWFLV